jgi:MFS family permease
MSSPIRLGLRENAGQFALLVLINGFVGAMVGLERAIVPLLGEQEFGVGSRTALLAFIGSFGLVKALTNLFAGHFSERIGRRPLLIAGWLAALPVPLLIIWAPTWSWIIIANLLLGVNQGLCWSTTVVMKIDLVGPRRRGLAMGLNEFAGYLAMAASAYAGSALAAHAGLRPEPFYLGVVFAITGLLLSVFLARETVGHARYESRQHDDGKEPPPFKGVFMDATWRDPALSSCSQAGMVNNLNDGLVWGLLPIFFFAAGLDLKSIGLISSVYLATWGVGQLFTGAASDRLGRKWMIAAGMWLQGAALLAMPLGRGTAFWLIAAATLGVGTALVYPTLLAAIADVARPDRRAAAVGVYRLWRDSGYVFGALLAGIVADRLGIIWAIEAVAGLTALSGLLVAIRMPETLRLRGGAHAQH